MTVQSDETDNRPLGVSVDHYTPERLQTEDQLPLALIQRLKTQDIRYDRDPHSSLTYLLGMRVNFSCQQEKEEKGC